MHSAHPWPLSVLILQLGILWGFVQGWVHSHPYIRIKPPLLYSLHHYNSPTSTYSAPSFCSFNKIHTSLRGLNTSIWCLLFVAMHSGGHFVSIFILTSYILVVHENPSTSPPPYPLTPYHPIIYITIRHIPISHFPPAPTLVFSIGT